MKSLVSIFTLADAIKCCLLIVFLFIFFPVGGENFSSVDIFVACGDFHIA